MTMQSLRRRPTHGFTLVELAIVMVIIGLLVGAIMAGKSMIRAQRVRDLLADARNYSVAMQQFREQYGQLPGDFDHAESVWGNAEGGAVTTNCVGYGTTQSPDTVKTCNGNGNGVLDIGSPAEGFWAWQQMGAAGLIAAHYIGAEMGGSITDAKPGTNVPASAVPTSGFWLFSWGVEAASTTFYVGDYTDTMTLGAINEPSWPYKALLKPAEAEAIDIKADDGAPGTGSIRTLVQTWALANNGDCVSSDNPAVAIWDSGVTTPTCILLFMNTFEQRPGGKPY
jgi:prepilin-type N-terminal cleavage/methylation domain-containing protein